MSEVVLSARRSQRLVRAASVGLAGLVFAALAVGPQAAGAAPKPAGAAAAAGITVRLDEMGLGSQVAFTGLTTERDLSIPVPSGMKPTALVGSLVLPTDIGSGWIEVMSGTVRVDVVRFTAKDASSSGIHLSIPLTNVTVANRSASLRLVSHVIPLDSTCYDRSSAYPLTLTAPAVVFSGSDTYSNTIADFLPPILRTMTIDVRGALTSASSQAALSLSSRIVQRYSSQPTVVKVKQIAAGATPPSSSDPLVRTIVIDPTGKSAVTVTPTAGRPALVVSGDSGALVDEIAGLTSDLSQIAQSSSATFAGATAPVTLAPSVFDFTDLGIGNLSSTSAGTVAVSFGVDQAKLGGRAAKLGLDLRATYTPLPASVGGLITISANGTQVAAWPTQHDGQLREHVDVPAKDLTRFTTFSLALSLTGSAGSCGNDLTDTLTVDPSSSVTVSLATGGAVGFGSLPQALVPVFDVAIDGTSFADLVRANTIVDGLQGETSIPLSPQLVTTGQALQAKVPALLVYPTTDAPASLDLPLRHADTSKYVEVAPAGTTASGSVTAPVQLGCLQVANDVAHKRVLLVATSPDGTGALLDKDLSWLGAEPGRWFVLSGNVLATAATGDPFTLSVGVPNPIESSKKISAVLVAGLSAGIVILLGLLVLWVALRRRRSASRVGAAHSGNSSRTGDEGGR